MKKKKKIGTFKYLWRLDMNFYKPFCKQDGTNKVMHYNTLQH